MASSLKPKKIYDVFLSFRGAELRHNFVGHLYQALDQNGIHTFLDSEELKKGDQISPMLMEAIEESHIAVIIFSEDYASSKWCLEEVVKIMECKEQRNLTVLPVFYKVEPREVRKGRMSYQKALNKHKSKLGEDSEKVKRWKKALFNAGSLSGWPLNDEDESKLIQDIVKQISCHLDRRMPLHVAKHPVGIESRVVMLKSMLNLESNDDVVMVGLWGQGGIGKTTLAKALYNSTFRQFEGSCFLANVRETSKGCKDLVTLQERLLKDTLLLQQRLEVSNVDQGINIIQHRLGRKKVLLILDDVDDLRQLNALAGEGKWFGNGSRIIITTRDKHVLTRQGIYRDHVYEVEALDDSQACELLSKHASQTHQIRKDLVNGALNYAKGLPLALEVLGSLLCGETKDVWKSTLRKFSMSPNKNINSVLKISYEGLDENEKEIFLHIACFFRGWKREYTKKVLESCNLEAIAGFEILVKRSLIRIESDILDMHDLIQLMGKDIVNQECREDPRRRSKLWSYDDVDEVLSNDKENSVKAIVLKLPECREMCIHPDAFTKMRRLRLLILHKLQDSFQGPLCLPKGLRWFEWPGCARQITGDSSGSMQLVGFDMSKSSITVVPEQFKDFQQLKYINLSYCESLIRIPDLSYTRHLEKLVLSCCKNMVEAHESIAYLEKLRELTLDGCSRLGVFPNMLKTKRLRHLHLTNCKKLERFPDIPHKLERLTLLSIKGTAIKELPSSIENLVSLEKLNLSVCKNLVSLPSSMYKLHNITELYLQGCISFIGFPKYDDSVDPSMKIGLSSLKSLNLAGSGLTELEFLENHSCCPKLRNLYLVGTKITSVPTSIFKRKHLKNLGLPVYFPLPYDHSIVDPYGSNGRVFLETVLLYRLRRNLHTNFPGAELPEWVLPIEKGFVSFRASEDLSRKFLGFVLCVVHSADEKDHGSQAYMEIEANGLVLQKYEWTPVANNNLAVLFTSFELLLGAVNYVKYYESHVQFSVKVSGGVTKKCGFRILCKQLEEDLKAVVKDLMDPALLYEFSHKSTYLKAKGPLMRGTIKTDIQNDLHDCPATPLSASRQLVSHPTTLSSDGCKIATYQRRRRRREEVCLPETESLAKRRWQRLESRGDGLPPPTEATDV